tara:strand:- start:277 stop:795 length:519 start_codon:yes stop_codon:yes gene_type:complete
MFISIFGYASLLLGFLILVLPLMLIELSRPRDWLIACLLLFSGFFLLVQSDLLRGSINLLVISISILFGKMILEISQNRWYQLSLEEKKRIGSFDRWFESFRQLGQIFVLIGNSFLNFFKSSQNLSKKSLSEKKWVHPDLQEDINKKAVETNDSITTNKISEKELTENDESS